MFISVTEKFTAKLVDITGNDFKPMASGYGLLLFGGSLVCPNGLEPEVTGDVICKAMGYRGFKDWDTFSLKQSFLNGVEEWIIVHNYAMYISELKCYQDDHNVIECLYIPLTSAYCVLEEAIFIECLDPGNLNLQYRYKTKS